MKNIIDIFPALRKKHLIDCNSNTHHTLTVGTTKFNFDHKGEVKTARIKGEKITITGVTFVDNKIKIKMQQGLYFCLTQNTINDRVQE